MQQTQEGQIKQDVLEYSKKGEKRVTLYPLIKI